MIALSFLGTGNYSETNYLIEGKKYSTKYFSKAVWEHYKPEKLFIVMTDEAEAIHDKELSNLFEYEKIKIPSGKNENELWIMFDSIISKIPESSEIIIDITHGFRSQPMIALAIAVFVKIAKKVTVSKVIYGAWEAKINNYSPVFDLTNFFNIVDWAYGIQNFYTHGDSKPLKRILSALHKKIYSENKQPVSIKNFGDLLNKITESLNLIRPNEVSSLSKELPIKIDKVKSDIESFKELRPLKYLLDNIPNSFTALTIEDENIFSNAGFKMQAEMIKYYLETEQYVQAVTLSRESIVSLVCKKNNINPIKKENRESAEQMLFEWNSFIKKGFKLEEFPANCGRMWDKITTVRNDINHAGMRENPCPASTIINNARRICQKTVDLIYANQSL